MLSLGRIFLISTVCAVSASVAWAKWQMDQASILGPTADLQSFDWSTTEPSITQDSIDQAVLRFGIRLDHNAAHPRFDGALVDRGITSRTSWHSKAEIRIGPAAFDSWALLGSTLAHEVEVHARQNFWIIGMLDAMGLDGTGMAERQAYAHELNHADRFQLSDADRNRIQYTMNHFYPLQVNKKRVGWTALSHRLSALLALKFPTFQ